MGLQGGLRESPNSECGTRNLEFIISRSAFALFTLRFILRSFSVGGRIRHPVWRVPKFSWGETRKISASGFCSLSSAPNAKPRPFPTAAMDSFEWCGLSDLVPEDMGKGKKSSSNGNNPTKLEQAMEFLEKSLSDGPVLVTQLLEDAEKMCPPINEKTLRRAKKLLGLKKDHSSKDNNGEWGWVWFLPEEGSQDGQDTETGEEI